MSGDRKWIGETAILLAGIIADTGTADLEGALTHRLVAMLFDALAIAFGQVLREFPYIADIMIERGIISAIY
jgi:hypothetical protein